MAGAPVSRRAGLALPVPDNNPEGAPPCSGPSLARGEPGAELGALEVLDAVEEDTAGDDIDASEETVIIGGACVDDSGAGAGGTGGESGAEDAGRNGD